MGEKLFSQHLLPLRRTLQQNPLTPGPRRKSFAPSTCRFILYGAKNCIRHFPCHGTRPKICLMYFTLRQLHCNFQHLNEVEKLTCPYSAVFMSSGQWFLKQQIPEMREGLTQNTKTQWAFLVYTSLALVLLQAPATKFLYINYSLNILASTHVMNGLHLASRVKKHHRNNPSIKKCLGKQWNT